MTPDQIIETTGSITKVERLVNIEQHVLSNTLVVKSKNPFPGYGNRENIAGNNMLNPVYLLLMYRYFPEKVERISKILREKYKNCSFRCGEIVIQNNIFPCIRIKGLTDDKLISQVQMDYKKNDIKFAIYKKVDFQAKIKVFKHFKITEIANGIYRDLYEGEKFYFIIPNQINWRLLGHLTHNIKDNIDNSSFDEALGIINRFSGPEDVIRIFDQNKTLKRALEIKNRYLKELKREIMLITNLKKTATTAFF